MPDHDPRIPSSPEPDPSTAPSPGPVGGPSSDPVRRPSPDPVRQPSSDPGRQPSPDPERQPSPDPDRQPSPDPELVEGLQGLAAHDEDGLDPAAVWHRGVVRRRRRGLVAGAVAVAVLAGGAWGASQGFGRPDVVVAGPSPSASLASSSLPTAGPVDASTLAGSSWRITTMEDGGGTTDMPETTWAFADPGQADSLVITVAGRREALSWRADGARLVVHPGGLPASPGATPGSEASGRSAFQGTWEVSGETGGLLLTSGNRRLHLERIVTASPSPAVPGRTASQSPSSMADMAGTSWALVEVRDTAGTHDVRAARATMRFGRSGHVEGNDGVAPFTASWGDPVVQPAVGGSFAQIAFRDEKIGAVGSAATGGSPVSVARGGMTKVLTAQVVGLGWSGGRLQMRTVDGTLLTFVASGTGTPRSMDDLAGTRWNVVEVVDATGTHDVAGAKSYASFPTDRPRDIDGNDGVNGFTCTWAPSAAGERTATAFALVSIRSWNSTAIGFAGPADSPVVRTEAAWRALGEYRLVALEMDGNRLLLKADDKALVLERA